MTRWLYAGVFSEIDATPSLGVVSECTSTACKQSARRKHIEPGVVGQLVNILSCWRVSYSNLCKQ